MARELLKADMTWEECIKSWPGKRPGHPEDSAEKFCAWLKRYGPGGEVSKSPEGKVPKGYTAPGEKKSSQDMAVAKKLVALAKVIVSAEDDKCGPSGCIKKVKGGWGVMSGKTGKMWPQTYKSKEDAEDALKRYHGWGFKK
jgi:hypothetical protein